MIVTCTKCSTRFNRKTVPECPMCPPEHMQVEVKVREKPKPQKQKYDQKPQREENEITPHGKLRLDLYRYLESEGFEMTKERHDVIKRMIVKIYENRVKTREITVHEPREHTLICPDCKSKRIRKGSLSTKITRGIKETKKIIENEKGSDQ